MIIKTNKVDPYSQTSGNAYKIGVAIFLLSLTVSVFLLAMVMKDPDDAATVPSVVKVGDQLNGELKSAPSITQKSGQGDVVIRPDRQILAEQNNVIERDALQIGEKQAESLRRELDTKPDLSDHERSNLVQTIRKLESGQVIIQ
ncbi:MAG: hypothetical protein A2283_03090 [Lentisphaerae bacterium RIFOXYA12_FULL_48_11]|nr:MAG: hypothetical protein A2283_03090 [Lentisphaerae bacterium RIFOXYA12_FULL_48_11]